MNFLIITGVVLAWSLVNLLIFLYANIHYGFWQYRSEIYLVGFLICLVLGLFMMSL